MPRRSARTLILVVVLLPGVYGCQTSPPTVQLDHPAPSFAMNRATAQPQREEPAIKQTAAASEPQLVELRKRDEADSNSTWTRLFGRLGKPKRIPLPRTDLDDQQEALAGEAEPAIGSF